MKVKDVMMRMPAVCDAGANVGTAVEILWNRNCGILPIVNSQRKVVGVVTDRDLCIALGTRNRLPSEITVDQVASGKVFSCKPDDDIRDALNTMARQKVRRLPVVNKAGALEGILSMDDVILHSEGGVAGKTSELSYDAVVNALKQVYLPELPAVLRQKAAGV
jgi:CBS domain-containing protein